MNAVVFTDFQWVTFHLNEKSAIRFSETSTELAENAAFAGGSGANAYRVAVDSSLTEFHHGKASLPSDSFSSQGDLSWQILTLRATAVRSSATSNLYPSSGVRNGLILLAARFPPRSWPSSNSSSARQSDHGGPQGIQPLRHAHRSWFGGRQQSDHHPD